MVTYRLPLGLFEDPDMRNITLDVRRKNSLGLPSFIVFDPHASDNGVLVLSPTYRDVGTTRLSIIAFNDLGLHSSVDATVVVNSVNSTCNSVEAPCGNTQAALQESYCPTRRLAPIALSACVCVSLSLSLSAVHPTPCCTRCADGIHSCTCGCSGGGNVWSVFLHPH